MKPFFRPIQLAAFALSMGSGCAISTDLSAGDVAATPETLLATSCPVLATCFTVTNINDIGPGSLREAISDANAERGDRIIKFNIAGPGPHVIQPVQELPVLLGNTTIDGFSQPGATPATDTAPPQIEIVINGALGAPGALDAPDWGLYLALGGNVVQGVAINDFASGSAIIVNGDDNVIKGNILGADRFAAVARPNEYVGAYIWRGVGNLIGGPGIEDRNVISGNGLDGVLLLDGPNEVYGNAIGTNFDGSVALGNRGSGVFIVSAGGNEIGGIGEGERNIIAFNGHDGITVLNGTDNTLSQNSLHDNGGLGIDLRGDGVSSNDGFLDLDDGPNARQNFPLLNSVTLDPATEYDGRYKAEVSWKLKSEANTKYRVEFFASSACDPSGHGEAEFSIGSRVLNTDSTGLVENVWVLPGRVAPGNVITATATKLVDVGETHTGTNTSELSKCLPTEL